MSETCGFVLAATGEKYRRLMGKAVRSLREHHPDHAIDVYTDVPIDLPEADQVHQLPEDSDQKRPQFHAMRTARFDRIVFLDVDLIVMAPVGDIFDILDRFDIAATHDSHLNSPFGRAVWNKPIPHAFPQLNTGVVGLRRTERMLAFLDEWEEGYRNTETGKDQPSFREILWDNPELRLAVLPPEYNFWDARTIDRLTPLHTAPRIMHNNTLARDELVAMNGGELARLLSHSREVWLRCLQKADHSIAALENREAHMPSWRKPFLRAYFRDIPRKAHALIWRLTH